MFQHAIELIVVVDPTKQPSEIRLRRAVSALYYALFHHINAAAAKLIAPNVPSETNYRIQRWFDHAEMKKVCGRFLPVKLDQPLLDLIGSSASPALQDVARTFIRLQEARHSADYDLGYNLTFEDATQFVTQAAGAMDSWNRIANSAEANIFILSLLMWKNWEKER
jgi:uncharacterized protein (UPF0332 family)